MTQTTCSEGQTGVKQLRLPKKHKKHIKRIKLGQKIWLCSKNWSKFIRNALSVYYVCVEFSRLLDNVLINLHECIESCRFEVKWHSATGTTAQYINGFVTEARLKSARWSLHRDKDSENAAGVFSSQPIRHCIVNWQSHLPGCNSQL